MHIGELKMQAGIGWSAVILFGLLIIVIALYNRSSWFMIISSFLLGIIMIFIGTKGLANIKKIEFG